MIDHRRLVIEHLNHAAKPLLEKLSWTTDERVDYNLRVAQVYATLQVADEIALLRDAPPTVRVAE